ncbi:tetratricopeptide repeat protein 14 homolog isoform X1 [Melanaphis sacchari]|uniref:Tetratricopeptide repeat protein 14 n=1 Tax=Melanaphis sacchari TaxID=742174 RepID=A0A2H8TLJ9_9HEMI|nr:tetratricopeptide repeat protein 14 homolog isoform X1 [Melanaphis sacchari]XP_025206786.1 tetratricopeptide repeat protein 14 homolog isoform X1 [Melanaphis sacchari]XP_025206787.1 tetratricopeptide repeat protein 14 homolog isoform X1 [Melanaphis sacchari]XP_025206788.1 tetratricopeptide repeat protein 14 homolog isoform X1 [Melanaphis sacchari]
MEVELDQDLLCTSLQFHGPKLQEALRSELGDVGEFTGLPTLSFPAYANGHSISNDLDNEKQLKLHKFIANNSKAFFNVDLLANNNKQKQCEDFEINSFTVMPPYEVFGYTNKEIKLKHFLNELSEGEIIITSISSKNISGLILKVLCTYTEPIRCVSDINVRGFCQASIPGLSIGDNLCCEVLEVVPEAFKLVCGIKGVKCHKKYKDLLGLFNMENCPQTFKLFHAGKNDDSYDSMLLNSTGFKNPSNICNLELITGLSDDRHSIMPSLSGSFPEKDTALELRKVQSAEWAIQSVSDGIKYFKAGQHSEAFLCLNKALTIDSLNVEAYVARGALYANLSRFQKAIEDLKSALKINPKHVNGRKYLGETLMGYARTLESQNKLEEALQYYEECLHVIPDHDEAKASIDYLKSSLLVGRTMTMNTLDSFSKKKIDTDLEKSASSSSSSNHSNSSSSESSSSGSSSDEVSTIDFDSDSDNTTSSDSSSDESSGNDSQKLEKERSLSPFSKRLAMMDGSNTNGGGLPCNPSFIATENSQSQQMNIEKESDIEERIQKLILLSQSNKIKKNKQIGINIQKLLQNAYALKNEEKKTDKKIKKSKDKKKSHKHKKKDYKGKQKSAKDHQEHHKKNKSKKHKFTEQSFDNEQQAIQKSSLPDPESVKSNLSGLKENIFFKKYVKQDKPSNDQNIIDKDNEQSDVFKANEIVEMPNTYKYEEDPSLIPTPKFKMQLPTTTTTYVKVKKKETTDSVPYNWDNNRLLPANHELMRTQSSNNNDTNNTDHGFPTLYDTNNKGYFNLPPATHPVSENNINNMEFQQKQSYLSPNNKQRSRSPSVSKRRINYSRSRSSGGRSSQSPYKKKPKETSKSKTRSRSGSYPRHRRYSSSRSNRSRSSSRSYSRSRSRSRSIHHRNRMAYYNNRNRGTYYKPRFQNQNHHNRGFQNRGFQHRGGYAHRQNYNNYNNNWNNRGQRGGGRQRFFHYRPRQYDRNRHYERRSYSVSPNRRSRSRSKSRSGSKNSTKEYRKRYSGSGEDHQHNSNNKPKTPPEPITETNKWQLDSNDNGNRNSQDHDEGSIE